MGQINQASRLEWRSPLTQVTDVLSTRSHEVTCPKAPSHAEVERVLEPIQCSSYHNVPPPPPDLASLARSLLKGLRLSPPAEGDMPHQRQWQGPSLPHQQVWERALDLPPPIPEW